YTPESERILDAEQSNVREIRRAADRIGQDVHRVAELAKGQHHIPDGDGRAAIFEERLRRDHEHPLLGPRTSYRGSGPLAARTEPGMTVRCPVRPVVRPYGLPRRP